MSGCHAHDAVCQSGACKSHDFDAADHVTKTDYTRMLQIVLRAKFSSWVGIEYKGTVLSEAVGATATPRLLRRLQAELA